MKIESIQRNFESIQNFQNNFESIHEPNTRELEWFNSKYTWIESNH